MVTYANNIFEEAGSTMSPSMASIVVGFLQLAGSVVASSLIERLGRKVGIARLDDKMIMLFL